MSFAFEHRASDSPYVDTVFRTETGTVSSFLSVATTRWSMVITTQYGRTRFTIRGPETRCSPADCPADAQFVGIVFKPGTSFSGIPAPVLVDRLLDLPTTAKRVQLDGSSWEFPTFENVDTFLARLARKALLRRDEVVEAALRGERLRLSSRSVQRRFQRVTGLTQKVVHQIERALNATRLLDQGMSIHAVVDRTGYFDQAHLTNSLKRFIGQTPTQLIKAPVTKSLY